MLTYDDLECGVLALGAWQRKEAPRPRHLFTLMVKYPIGYEEIDVIARHKREAVAIGRLVLAHDYEPGGKIDYVKVLR